MHHLWPVLWNKRITSLTITRNMGKTMTHNIVSAYVAEKLNTEGNEEKQEALVEFIF